MYRILLMRKKNTGYACYRFRTPSSKFGVTSAPPLPITFLPENIRSVIAMLCACSDGHVGLWGWCYVMNC